VGDRLYRSRDDRILAGVAGGVAETLDADPSIIRIVWALLVFLTGGLALLVYIVMAIVVPERPDGVEVRRPADTTGAPPAAGPVSEGGWVAPDGSVVPMASAPPTGRRARRRDPAARARGGIIAGLLLILLGGFFLVRQFVPSFDAGLWWPVVAIGLGVVLVVLALLPSSRSG
jgi:phage shock protein PspC (stress-responsive transcriptional regulator)